MKPNGVAVFITGCDTGIGNTLARYFSEMRCRVFAGCLNPDAAKTSLPDTVSIVKLDITDEDSVREAVNTVREMLSNENKAIWHY
ncbi:d-beta-hydroxybutyrate dehydrogenase, mitochondrial [Caerostris darwini]|uniref:D-beta-hydroxybutyrate dehydrogenase, mitochondrial n=1 Tax=Caerostris darwini TaxID=1538125 RepID=A0AAV4UFM6_9ARAC|nr:d-beta-hydroxybutyrate dehydrogenase, mitochondrial [Caerostris darwini]